MPARRLRVGLISDTHGLLRPEALDALRGSDYIVHAGDIGDPAILTRLAELAALTAVRGNNDVGPWARPIPDVNLLDVGGVRIFVLHDIAQLPLDPRKSGYQVVVSGHSHRPHIETRDDVLFVNPGSAGPRRFSLPVSVGMLAISTGDIEPQLVTLQCRPAAHRD